MKSKIFILIFFIFCFIGCRFTEKDNRIEFFPKTEITPNEVPKKENVWVFILAGQSNMAGRGKVEPIDTIPDSRILTINKNGHLILAKEPLHFYEPTMTGLDCGLSFGKSLLKHIPKNISILLIPTAVGGSSLSQWINDSQIKHVSLLSNFKEKIEIGKKYGEIQGILWHQGESDASKKVTIEKYDQHLLNLFTQFRDQIGNKKLPIFIGELGSYSKNKLGWKGINEKIRIYLNTDSNSYLIKTIDLRDKGDRVHFNANGERLMGQRFANEFLERKK